MLATKTLKGYPRSVQKIGFLRDDSCISMRISSMTQKAASNESSPDASRPAREEPQAPGHLYHRRRRQRVHAEFN